jgi:hypothetical protein
MKIKLATEKRTFITLIKLTEMMLNAIYPVLLVMKNEIL